MIGQALSSKHFLKMFCQDGELRNLRGSVKAVVKWYSFRYNKGSTNEKGSIYHGDGSEAEGNC